MKKFYLCIFSLFVLSTTFLIGQTTGDFRSAQTGNWGDLTTWQTWDGTGWVAAVTTPDASTGAAVTVVSPNEVTVTATVTVRNVTVNAGATLIVNGTPVVLNISDEGMTVNGVLTLTGTVASAAPFSINLTTGTLTIGATGVVNYNQTAATTTKGALPTATWLTGSTLNINSTGGPGATGWNSGTAQNFYNVNWNCPAMTGSFGWGFTNNTIGGTLAILATNSGRVQFFGGSSGTLNIMGDFIVSGSSNATVNGTSAATDDIINVYGKVNVNTTGNFSISRGSQNGTGTSIFNFYGDSVKIIAGAMSNSNTTPNGAKFTFKKNGIQYLTITPTTLSGNSLPIEVGAGSIVSLASPVNVTTLYLNGGKILSSALNPLIMGWWTGTTLTSGTVSATAPGSSTSFVDGPMAFLHASATATSKTYPIGKGLYYRPLTLALTQTAAVISRYTAEVFNTPPLANTLPGTLDRVTPICYYSISELAGGSSFTNGSVLLNYSLDDGVSDASNLRIAQGLMAGGGTWTDLGGTGTGAPAGAITSTTAFTDLTTNNVFTLANNTGGSNTFALLYQSAQSGNWGDVTTWQVWNGSGWVAATSTPDTITASSVTVLSPHNVTVAASVAARNVTINTGATLTINGTPVTLYLAQEGMTVNGTLNLTGEVASAYPFSITFTTGALRIANGGVVNYNQTSTTTSTKGALPIATWQTGSTLNVNSTGGTATTGWNAGTAQNFYNINWNCPSMTANFGWGFINHTIGGTISILNTNTGRVQFFGGASGTLNVLGDFIVSGAANATVNGTSSATNDTINIYGKVNINTTGNFSISRGSQGGSGTSVLNLYSDSVKIAARIMQNSNSTGAKFVFKKNGIQYFTLIPDSVTGNALPFEAAAGSIVRLLTPVNATTLYLNGGMIQSSTLNPLIMGWWNNNTQTLTSGTVSPAFPGSATSFVDGPMKYLYATAAGSTSKVYPIGKGLNYRPVTLSLTQTAATLSTYTAEFFNAAPPAKTLPGTLNRVSNTGYFSISELPGGSDFTAGSVTLNYAAGDGVSDAPNLRIAQGPATGGAWTDLGGTGTGAPEGTITSTVPFTDLVTNTLFTLANNTGGTNFAPSSFPLSVNITNGWNMVSVPGLHPTNQNVDTWWVNRNPLASVYKWAAGYVAVTNTAPRDGYWMLHNGTQTYNTGDEWPAGGIQIVAHDPIPITAGWNMIGGYETSPLVSALTTTPPGLIIAGTTYGWNGSYYNATNLVPGYGYWIYTSGAGFINLPTGLEKRVLAKEGNTENWGKIILTDASGKKFTLYSINGEVNLDHYLMPPLPPAGCFDVRYSSGRKAENLNKTNQTIEMSGVKYPVTIMAEKTTLRIQDPTGKSINTILKPGEVISINKNEINKLLVSADVIPVEYSLSQNYPNPFNPSCNIEFTLPEDVQNVRLTIYNVLGEKVTELINTALKAGYYNYKWNASGQASGIYIYNITTDKFVSTKKMILMK